MEFAKPSQYFVTFTGNVRMIGPFKTAEAAAKYCVKEFVAAGNYEWRIAPVKPPYR